MKYSDQFTDWLVADGYTHCFFVAGGNIMHLLDSVRTRMTCVPFVHEVAAGIAAEYFNEVQGPTGSRAFALVTAGPGVTNLVTALAGAYLESRDLLVVGGQVKSTDLAGPGLRQRGIQEVDGVAIVEAVTVGRMRITTPVEQAIVMSVIRGGRRSRKGPVFIEFCLDAQAAPAVEGVVDPAADAREATLPPVLDDAVEGVAKTILHSARPLVLIGGGVDRAAAARLVPRLAAAGLSIATTWNAADRMGSDEPGYFGRPNTWGMRWSNILLQQADVVLALGTRLGLQQTGFNWEQFAPLADVIQVDVDPAELHKGHPAVDVAIEADAALFLDSLLVRLEDDLSTDRWSTWRAFGREVAAVLPLSDPGNTHGAGYLDPYDFVVALGDVLNSEDVVVPCSSGGAFTVMMQAFANKRGQVVVSNKGLASMGYGLSGAIGASLASGRRTILVEGDGGFAQNLQELGTVAAQALKLKIFIFANEGYASIRMTQRNYFGGAYVGCDTATGLGLPDWQSLFSAYGIRSHVLNAERPFDEEARELLDTPGPGAFIVPIDPEQTYYPKITSRVTPSGGMESNPLHLMDPRLDDELGARVMPFLRGEATDEQD